MGCLGVGTPRDGNFEMIESNSETIVINASFFLITVEMNFSKAKWKKKLNLWWNVNVCE
jgi:hypothetical protein